MLGTDVRPHGAADFLVHPTRSHIEVGIVIVIDLDTVVGASGAFCSGLKVRHPGRGLVIVKVLKRCSTVILGVEGSIEAMRVYPHCKAGQILLPHGKGVFLHVRREAGIYCCHFVGIGYRWQCAADENNRFEMLRAHNCTDTVALGLMRPTADNACIADEVFAGRSNRRDVGGSMILLGDRISGLSDGFAPEG